MAPEHAVVTSTIEKRAQELMDKFSCALNDGDIDTLVSLYAPDAAVMAPNTPTITRMSAIHALYTSFVNMGCTNVNMKVTRVVCETEHVIACGTYSLDIANPKGPKASDHGKFLCVQEEQPDGSWKFLFDMWNSDLPLEKPANA